MMIAARPILVVEADSAHGTILLGRAGKRVERFADATGLVLKRHHVAIDEKVATEELPAYVRRALNIMAGKEPLHLINNPLAIGAHPAIVSHITPVDLSEKPSL